MKQKASLVLSTLLHLWYMHETFAPGDQDAELETQIALCQPGWWTWVGFVRGKAATHYTNIIHY